MKKIIATMVTLCLALMAYGGNDNQYNKNQIKKDRLGNFIPNKTNYVDPLRAKFEANKPKPPMKGKFKPSEFDVIPLNSPVKGTFAKFLLKLPTNFEIEDIKFRVQNASHIFIKEKDYSTSKLIDTTNGKELHIPLADQLPGFYRLYVKIKTKKDKYAEHQYQSAYLDFVRFIVAERSNGIPLPDPIENKATVAGVDSDRNGIRDDIQIWINDEFEDRPIVKLGMEQFARYRTMQLLKIDNIEESRIVTTKALDSGSCLSGIIGIDEKIVLAQKLEEKLINTKDRMRASIQSSANFSGMGYAHIIDEEEKKSVCEFNY